AAFEFLLADPRRFWLGGLHDDQGDSIELIAATAPHLADEQFNRLVAAIRTWEMYPERAEDQESQNRDRVYERGRRFRLLTALPGERLSDELRREIEAERSALPEHVKTPRHPYSTGMRCIVSPVSHEEMVDRADCGRPRPGYRSRTSAASSG